MQNQIDTDHLLHSCNRHCHHVRCTVITQAFACFYQVFALVNVTMSQRSLVTLQEIVSLQNIADFPPLGLAVQVKVITV